MTDATTNPRTTQTPATSALGPLAALIGHWRTRGHTIPQGAEPPIEIDGYDHYEWFAGGHFLEHTAKVRIGDETIRIVEYIGEHDAHTDSYAARSFDSRGEYSTMSAAVDDTGVWTFRTDSIRATLRIAEDGATMTALWENLENGTNWHPWMNMTFTRADHHIPEAEA